MQGLSSEKKKLEEEEEKGSTGQRQRRKEEMGNVNDAYHPYKNQILTTGDAERDARQALLSDNSQQFQAVNKAI